MNDAARFGVVEQLVIKSTVAPSWFELGTQLEMPDTHWQPFDPLLEVSAVSSQWTSVAHDWTNVQALWLGLESDGSRSFVDPVAFTELDDNDFPSRMAWQADRWYSETLTEFAKLAPASTDYAAYDYTLPLAWLALLVHHVRPAPPHVFVLAGHGDGDYLAIRS